MLVLQGGEVSKNKLQLVGVTAMWIASKYEEMYAPEVSLIGLFICLCVYLSASYALVCTYCVQLRSVSGCHTYVHSVSCNCYACEFIQLSFLSPSCNYLKIADFVYITDNAYTKASIRQMERVMLKRLNFDLGRPLPLHFLRRYSKAAEV